MSPIRSLILLLLLTSLCACSYGFVLEGTSGTKKIGLEPSLNKTHLAQAGIVLDSYMEQSLLAMGMLSPKAPDFRLECTIVSSSRERITSNYLLSGDRYRLFISVLAKATDAAGKVIWQKTFSDQGTFLDAGQDEDALDEALKQVSLQIARALAAVKL